MGSLNMDNDDSHGGLGNPLLLNKIDKLRELGVGSRIPLPQVVVVGDQSTGKSSVLESMTGFCLPRDVDLCTRYATQITCHRVAKQEVSISIIPSPQATSAHATRLREFHQSTKDIQGEDFLDIYQKANQAMGIRSSAADGNGEDGLTTFSEDILRIEISGPDQKHLTVIDVPGIFRATTDGLTTQSDIAMVNNMVRRYMKDPRTIILAIIPCNVDPATQEILQVAKDVDPEGLRTMGVLTKPDLAFETATIERAIDFVLGKRHNLRLGYCIVKNRSADDKTSSLAQRNRVEAAFFQSEPWSVLAETGRIGITSLTDRTQELLMDVCKREFPNVKADVTKRLNKCNSQLAAMGISRATAEAQRMYLTRLSTEFQQITSYALNAYYTEHPVFNEDSDMRLITRIVLLNEAFSNVFATKGHLRYFDKKTREKLGKGGEKPEDWLLKRPSPEPVLSEEVSLESDMGEAKPPAPSKSSKYGPESVDFPIPRDIYPEIQDIIVDEAFVCPSPKKNSIMKHIEHVFKNTRGPELGSIGGMVLDATFREQSKKWDDIVLSHVSDAIVLVHHFVFKLIGVCCPEKTVRDQLWDSVLRDELCEAYSKAMERARELLSLERDGKPVTVNHYFNSNLQRERDERLGKALADMGYRPEGFNQQVISLNLLKTFSRDKGNEQQAREDAHDTLKSYYKLARKRIADHIVQEPIGQILLNGKDSPLKIFCPNRVAEMTKSQLEMIAGEDLGSKARRQHLTNESQRMTDALQVLRK